MNEQDTQNATDPTELSIEDLNAALEAGAANEEDPSQEGLEGEGAQKESEKAPEPTVAELMDKLKQVEEQAESDRVMIKRQSNQLGTLRKKVYTPPTKEEKEALADRVTEGDFSAMDEYAERRANMDYANQVAVKEAIPDFEDIKQDIIDVAISEGYDQEAINYFVANPWRTDSLTTIALARKAMEKKEYIKLKTEVETLRKPTDIVGAIEKAQRSVPSITPSTPSASQSGEDPVIGVDQVSKLSDADLDALLNKTN